MLRLPSRLANGMSSRGFVASQAVSACTSSWTRPAFIPCSSSWIISWPNYNVIRQLVSSPPSLTSVSTCGPSFVPLQIPSLRRTNISPWGLPFPSSIIVNHTRIPSPRYFATESFPKDVKMGSVTNTQDAPTVRVFIAGGSYAGLSTAVNLLDLGQGLAPRMFQAPYEHHPDLPRVNWEITIADERDGFYHLIGSPLALADAEYSKKTWVKFQDLPGLQTPQVKFISGSVSSVDCEAKTATTIDNATKIATTHDYDYFVAATGLRRVWPVVPQSLTRKQYLLEVEEHIHSIANARHGVVVVGGGAVGIEMAAELKTVKPDIKVTLIHSREKLLSSEGLSDECKDKALDLLKDADVEVLMSHRLATTTKVETTDGSSKYELEFTNGKKMTASEVIMALSKSKTTATYLPSSALDEEGYIKIEKNSTFVPGTPNAEFHFCAGDLTKWSGIKRCGWAMHGGHYVAQNIHKFVIKKHVGQEPKFMEFSEMPPMIGLAVGKKAVASSPDGTEFGEDTMKSYFKHDLGFTICWDWMGLAGRQEEIKTTEN